MSLGPHLRGTQNLQMWVLVETCLGRLQPQLAMSDSDVIPVTQAKQMRCSWHSCHVSAGGIAHQQVSRGAAVSVWTDYMGWKTAWMRGLVLDPDQL